MGKSRSTPPEEELVVAPTFDMQSLVKAIEEWKLRKPTLLLRPENAETMAPLAQLVNIKTSKMIPEGSALIINTSFLDDLVKAS